MSNLGFQTLYYLLNSMEGVVAERAFLPAGEDMVLYGEGGEVLFTLESGRAVRDSDIIAFSLSFEDDYVNVPLLLGLAGLEPRAARRAEGAPPVIAGGIAASLNPWPLSDFIDAFIIGEAEGAVEEFMGAYACLVYSSPSPRDS